jgi:glycosyltransferase involved in cell wall biosynthesis
MKVLYLTMNPNRESTTVPTEGWFRLLRPRGLEPVLVSRTAGAFQAWASSQGIPSELSALPFPGTGGPLPFLKSLIDVVRIGRRHRVQLIHCNEHDVYPVGQYAARLLGVPVVVSVHFTLRDGFSRWAFGGKRCPDRLLFISRGSLEACRPDVGGVVPEDRWRVLYNGLDTTRFTPRPDLGHAFRAEHRIAADALCLGVACALRPRKQLEHFFEAASRLRHDRLRIVVAGGPVKGDEAYAEQLLAGGRRLLGDRLVHVGHLNDLIPFYNSLDLFVNTSQEEACSISVIESLSCGCPIVGYPSTSVDEQVLPGGGEIVRQDSIEELAQTLQRLIDDPPRLAQLRIGARERATGTFDIDLLAGKIWDEYVSLVA